MHEPSILIVHVVENEDKLELFSLILVYQDIKKMIKRGYSQIFNYGFEDY